MSLPPTHVVVDGSNIATEGRSTPSLQQLDEGVRAFLHQYPHDIYTVVVDATFEHRIDPSERKIFEEAHENGEVITPPAGTIGRGDKFLLEIADRSGATVFSNDSFQEFHGEYSWLFNNGRLIGGKAVAEVGWVFAFRSPVRGPRSRQAVKEAREPENRSLHNKALPKGKNNGELESKTSRPKTSRAPIPKLPPAVKTREPQRRRGAPAIAKPVVAVNAPMPFIQFIAEHPLSSTVEGEVVEFASHGAYVMVGEVRCYVPTKLMGDPAPRGPRDVLDLGEVRSFVVQALDAPRRGIDLALPGFEQIQMDDMPSEKAASPARKAAVKKAPAKKAPAKKAPVEDTVSTKKVAAKKAPAKKAVVKKAPAKKVAAKKVAAKKVAAKKVAAKKAPAKKAVVKKVAKPVIQ